MAEQQSSNSPLSLTLLDPDVLECPICCEPLKIPIFQCENGHLVCSVCCKKVKNLCPSCKSPIGNSRCRAMERIIKATRLSCPNAKYGCKEHTAFGKPSSHEKECVFAPCSCPLSYCYYTGSYENLYDHICTKHTYVIFPFIWNESFNINLELDLNKTSGVFQEEEDSVLIILQAFSRSHGLTISVNSIAPLAPRLSRFSCCLKFATSNYTLKHAFMLREYQKVSEEPEDSFMLIPSYVLPSDGEFTMTICFSRGLGCVSRA